MRGARARNAGIRRRERFGFAAAESRAVIFAGNEIAEQTKAAERIGKLRVALSELVAEFVPAMFRPMVAPLITNLSVAKALTHFRAKGFVIEELEPGE